MRITGGNARGIPLRLPARGEIRPATDYLREAVFSSLGAFVVGARVLDLFSGTGAYGLEALSRGALHATFVEKNPAAQTVLRANAAAVQKALRSARGGDGDGEARTVTPTAITGVHKARCFARGAEGEAWATSAPPTTAAGADTVVAVGTAADALPCTFYQHDALRWEPPPGETYDIVFCDPPWSLWQGAAADLPARIARWTHPGPDSRIILEGPGDWHPLALPTAWREHRRLAKGKTQPSALILRPGAPRE